MEYIIGSLVGAIIGYITNWLAIKMLFRPHKEIRIGKFKVPFTPGLIPKERHRMARSVGETIGRHLLTKDTIIQSLCSESMNEHLDSWVQTKVKAIESSNRTVRDEIKAVLGDEYPYFIEQTNMKLSKFLINYINEKSVKQAVGKYIKEQVMLQIANRPQAISQSQLYKSIKNRLLDMIIEYRDSEKFYIQVKKLIEEKVYEIKGIDKSFQEVIPEEIADSIKVYVYDKKANIAAAIKELLKQEKTEEKLKEIIGSTISAKLNPMIAMFINVDKIYQMLVMGLYEFLDNEENHNDIALMVNEIIDGLLKSSVSSVVSGFPEEGINSGIKSLINLFKEEIVDEKFIRGSFQRIEHKFNSYQSIEEMLKESGMDYESTIEVFVQTRIEAIVESNFFKTKLADVTALTIDKLLNADMKMIFNEEGDKISSSISKVVRDLYNKFIENEASGIIELIDVAKIVEDKINEFDVDYAEQIILEISSRELKAITWLGALLGAIMGLLSPVMSSFY